MDQKIFTQTTVKETEAGNFQLTPYFAAITVKNIDSSITWYKKVLSLEERNRVDSEERGFKQAVLTGSGISIELVELKSMLNPGDCLKGQPKGTELLGYYKFGFIVNEFDSWVKHLQELEVNFWGKVVTDQISG